MCVKVLMLGRLGNNLFQYALGRIIAETLGLELDCSGASQIARHITPEIKDVPNYSTLSELTNFFPHAPLRISGRRFETPVQSFEVTPSGKWDGHTLDLQALLKDLEPRQIRIKGWFQKFSYYEPYKSKIRKWFRPKMLPVPYEISSNDVVVSIRRGLDVSQAGWTLPVSYYERVLSGIAGIDRVYVCGTCVDEIVQAGLARFSPVYYVASPMHHFNFIRRFNRIVLSNSTFSWWAAFLSEAEQIFAPTGSANVYGFTRYRDVDLHMREDRYKEVPLLDLDEDRAKSSVVVQTA